MSPARVQRLSLTMSKDPPPATPLIDPQVRNMTHIDCSLGTRRDGERSTVKCRLEMRLPFSQQLLCTTTNKDLGRLVTGSRGDEKHGVLMRLTMHGGHEHVQEKAEDEDDNRAVSLLKTVSCWSRLASQWNVQYNKQNDAAILSSD